MIFVIALSTDLFFFIISSFKILFLSLWSFASTSCLILSTFTLPYPTASNILKASFILDISSDETLRPKYGKSSMNRLTRSSPVTSRVRANLLNCFIVMPASLTDFSALLYPIKSGQFFHIFNINPSFSLSNNLVSSSILFNFSKFSRNFASSSIFSVSL